MSNRRSLLRAAAVAVIVFCGACAAHAVTGDEILYRMEDALSIGGADGGEGFLLAITVSNRYASGATNDYRLAVAAQTFTDSTRPVESDETSHVLMYFLGGDEEGMVFLLQMPEDAREKSRMWLYISAFGLTKELVSEDDQSGSFAGSTLTYGDIAGANALRDDYAAEIVRTEAVLVGTESRLTWVLELTPRAGVEADHSRVVLWVDQEANLFLRLEGYDAAGVLAKEIVVHELGEFDGRRVPERMEGRDPETGDVSTLTLSGLRRPDGGFAPGLFDPANVGAFDPLFFGF